MLNLKKWQEISWISSIFWFFATILLLLIYKESPNLIIVFLTGSSLILCPLSLDLSLIFLLIHSYQESTIRSQLIQSSPQTRSLSLPNLRLNSHQENTFLARYIENKIKRLEDLEEDSTKIAFISIILSSFIISTSPPDLIKNIIAIVPAFGIFGVGTVMSVTISFLFTRSVRWTREVYQRVLIRIIEHLKNL